MAPRILGLLVAVISLLSGACSSPSTASSPPAASTIVFADGATVVTKLGGSAYTNVVSGVGTGSVTYTSGTLSTATVNASSGAVTFVATGTTVITANKAADADHSSVTKSYTLTVVPSSFAIGNAFQGGKVAYILQSGDPGYATGGALHGLIAATADEMGMPWALAAYQSTDVAGAHGTAIGTGLANTNAIVAQNGPGTGYAAGICDAYSVTDSGTVYSDWYLPSRDELDKLYVNQGAVGAFFAGTYYWSSSAFSATAGGITYFTNGTTAGDPKNQNWSFRAVRSF